MEKKMQTTIIGLRGLGIEGLEFNLGYCPHPVTVYIRGPVKCYI